jgi:two-component system, cell cycle response regulator DivK
MPKILLVEDDEMNRDMLGRRLRRKGFDVLESADGEDAIVQTVRELPDLVLMDMSLPVLDGWSATTKLKETPETGNIPVIALTAHAMAGDRDKALQAGCDDYDTKPIEFKRLLQKINTLLER